MLTQTKTLLMVIIMGKLKLLVSYNSSYNKIHSHINFFAYMYMFPSVSENIQITCSMTVISYNVKIKQSINFVLLFLHVCDDLFTVFQLLKKKKLFC